MNGNLVLKKKCQSKDKQTLLFDSYQSLLGFHYINCYCQLFVDYAYVMKNDNKDIFDYTICLLRFHFCSTAIKSVYSFCIRKSENPKYKRKDFMILGAVFFLYGVSLGANFDTLYLMDEPLCWGSEAIGYVTTFKVLNTK